MTHDCVGGRSTLWVFLALGLALGCVGSPAPRPDGSSQTAGGSGAGGAAGEATGGAAGQLMGEAGQGAAGTAGMHGGATDGGAADDGATGGAGGGPAPCPPKVVDGDTSVQSDAALASLAGATVLDGSLSIGGAVSELGLLRCLGRINGSLTISGTSLTSVDGLAGLRIVGGRLFITSNASLMTLGFGRLETVGSDVWIQHGGALTTIELGALTKVGSYYGSALAFDNLPKLTRIDLHGLGETPRGGALTISNAGAAATAALAVDLSALAALGNTLSLVAVANLHDVDGFGALRTIAGRLLVTTNGTLQNLDGFGHLETVGSDVVIEHDALLVSIDLGALTVVGSAVGNSLRLDALPSLTTIGLDSLSSIAGCLTVTNNPGLPTCQATAPRMRLEEIGWTPCGTIAGNLVDVCSAGP